MISIHAHREGGDRSLRRISQRRAVFQSTPPARGATSMLPSRTEPENISIHAPREGGDSPSMDRAAEKQYFNPRPPRGGRLVLVFVLVTGFQFQSTPPARGATKRYLLQKAMSVFISIHAPREGGDILFRQLTCLNVISIHAPREGGDIRRKVVDCTQKLFQSTPPARGATTTNP